MCFYKYTNIANATSCNVKHRSSGVKSSSLSLTFLKLLFCVYADVAVNNPDSERSIPLVV